MNWRTPMAGALAAGMLALTAGASATGVLAHRDDLDPKDRLRVARVTAPTSAFGKPEAFEPMSGGAATSRMAPSRDAFSQFSANLAFDKQQTFKVGNGFFRKVWVSAPASTLVSDGLGPLFNARACQNCHLKDGRGHAPGPDGSDTFLMRLSVPGPDGADVPEPTYGGQFQDHAVAGLAAEGRVVATFTPVPVTLGDGTVVTLRKPSYALEDLAYGPMRRDVKMSPRIAQPMIGLGLLEAVDEGDILAGADPDDRDGDGISGRPNHVVSDRIGARMLGRFGWKAGQPTIEQQSAHAFAGDMGLSTPLLTAAFGDCTPAQVECRTMPDGVQPKYGPEEVPEDVLALVTFYSRNLAVPARRGADDPTVLAGKKVFYDAGCAACHRPKFVTRRDAAVPELAFQLIWPYTDMLVHDMGEGLADHRPEGEADGREWRTAPLWGIGLTETVNGHTEFLHDGRARNLVEAILWHGGEAQAARDRFAALPAAERDALVAFLNSL